MESILQDLVVFCSYIMVFLGFISLFIANFSKIEGDYIRYGLLSIAVFAGSIALKYVFVGWVFTLRKIKKIKKEIKWFM